MNTSIIVAMATGTVISFTVEVILKAAGKAEAAQTVDFITKAGLGTTALTLFATFIKTAKSLI